MRRRAWTWRGELDIPNGAILRDPWGVYLRLRWLRVAFGPRFKATLQIGRIK